MAKTNYIVQDLMGLRAMIKKEIFDLDSDAPCTCETEAVVAQYVQAVQMYEMTISLNTLADKAKDNNL